MAVRDDFSAGEVLAAADLNDTFAAKLDLAGGKILQIVRATDSTDRTTTSTSLVDANISVTITPQKSDSAVLLIWAKIVRHPSSQYIICAITDSSNNAISGANVDAVGASSAHASPAASLISIGYATPATTSATTYKGRFRSSGGGSASILNSGNSIGQMYAIEVSA